ncbi:MAG: hypothetical protein IKY27_00200 [Bacteroidales bacterium]|nr:hypothetical protein [Bacteroidales bacterium]
MTNELKETLVNEEAIEMVAEEVVNEGTGKLMKVGLGVGAVFVIGALAYAGYKKFKKVKNQVKVTVDGEEVEAEVVDTEEKDSGVEAE